MSDMVAVMVDPQVVVTTEVVREYVEESRHAGGFVGFMTFHELYTDMHMYITCATGTVPNQRVLTNIVSRLN